MEIKLGYLVVVNFSFRQNFELSCWELNGFCNYRGILRHPNQELDAWCGFNWSDDRFIKDTISFIHAWCLIFFICQWKCYDKICLVEDMTTLSVALLECYDVCQDFNNKVFVIPFVVFIDCYLVAFCGMHDSLIIDYELIWCGLKEILFFFRLQFF